MTPLEMDMLERCIKLGEAHLHDKINLLNLIERAIVQLRRGRAQHARVLLERAVKEVIVSNV